MHVTSAIECMVLCTIDAALIHKHCFTGMQLFCWFAKLCTYLSDQNPVIFIHVLSDDKYKCYIIDMLTELRDINDRLN